MTEEHRPHYYRPDPAFFAMRHTYVFNVPMKEWIEAHTGMSVDSKNGYVRLNNSSLFDLELERLDRMLTEWNESQGKTALFSVNDKPPVPHNPRLAAIVTAIFETQGQATHFMMEFGDILKVKS